MLPNAAKHCVNTMLPAMNELPKVAAFLQWNSWQKVGLI